MIIGRERNWKRVRKEKLSNNLFVIYLDEVLLKTDQGNHVSVSERLADKMVKEWSMEGKIDTIKNSFFTKFCFAAIDITENEREAVLGSLADYSNCDPICYIADEPTKLHLKQKDLYKPLIDWTENFLLIKLNKASGLSFVEQPSLNSSKIKKYLEELDNFHLTAVHEITKSLGSLFTCLALYNNKISSELAWEIANVEDNFRIEVWGEVEEETQKKNTDSYHFKCLVNILQLI